MLLEVNSTTKVLLNNSSFSLDSTRLMVSGAVDETCFQDDDDRCQFLYPATPLPYLSLCRSALQRMCWLQMFIVCSELKVSQMCSKSALYYRILQSSRKHFEGHLSASRS